MPATQLGTAAAENLFILENYKKFLETALLARHPGTAMVFHLIWGKETSTSRKNSLPR